MEEPRCELAGSISASAGISASRFSSWQDEVWRANYTAGGQTLTLQGRRLHRVGLLAGAELRLGYWLDDGPHGLLFSLGHQQGQLPLLAFESREFSYPLAGAASSRGTCRCAAPAPTAYYSLATACPSGASGRYG